jgi:hypothetical protein
MDKKIKIHKKLGVNPRIVECSKCGEGEGIAFLGENNYKSICCKCNSVEYGVALNSKKCSKCGGGVVVFELEERENLKINYCFACKKKEIDKNVEELHSEYIEEINKGGVIFICEKCSTMGIIKNSDASAYMRKLAWNNMKEKEETRKLFEKGLFACCIPKCPNCK